MRGQHRSRANADGDRELRAGRSVTAIRFNPRTRERSLDALRLGLVPHGAKDISIGADLIHARCETVAEKPSFREAFAQRRCLIPAQAFYQRKKSKSGWMLYAIEPTDIACFSFAAIWENWRDTLVPGGAWIRTCAIITCPPNELVAPFHDRMPAILPPETWPKWLGEIPADRDELLAMLKPYPASRMRVRPLSARVNEVGDDGADLFEPVIADG